MDRDFNAKKIDMKEDGTTQVKIETKPAKKKGASNQSRNTKKGAKGDSIELISGKRRLLFHCVRYRTENAHLTLYC